MLVERPLVGWAVELFEKRGKYAHATGSVK
jgi:hypothetical protein